jgi:hypothetical protein
MKADVLLRQVWLSLPWAIEPRPVFTPPNHLSDPSHLNALPGHNSGRARRISRSGSYATRRGLSCKLGVVFNRRSGSQVIAMRNQTTGRTVSARSHSTARTLHSKVVSNSVVAPVSS